MDKRTLEDELFCLKLKVYNPIHSVAVPIALKPSEASYLISIDHAPAGLGGIKGVPDTFSLWPLTPVCCGTQPLVEYLRPCRDITGNTAVCTRSEFRFHEQEWRTKLAAMTDRQSSYPPKPSHGKSEKVFDRRESSCSSLTL